MNSIKDRILIVESNAEISESLAKQALSSPNYQVFQVADASIAINKAVQINPDLIITNINLPGLSGKDLLVALSSRGITPPTIMIASEGQELELIQAFRLGAADYILWPARETEVILVVDRLLKQVHEQREQKMVERQLRLSNQQLHQRVKELTAIFTVGKTISSITNQKKLLEKTLQISTQVSQSDIGWFLIRQEEKVDNFILAAHYNLPDVLSKKINSVWDDGISSLTAISGETLNIAGDPIKRFKVKVFGESIIIVPVKIHRQVAGLLVLMRKEAKPYLKSEQRFLEALTEYVSISLINSKLVRSLETHEQVLQNLVDHTQTSEKATIDLLNKTKSNIRQIIGNIEREWEQIKGVIDDSKPIAPQKSIEDFDSHLQQANDLLSLTKEKPDIHNVENKSEFDLLLLMEDLKTHFQKKIEDNNLTITTHLSDQPIKVSADRQQIFEILQEILANLSDNHDPHQQITINVEEKPDMMIGISISNPGGFSDQFLQQILKDEVSSTPEENSKFAPLKSNLPLIQEMVAKNNGKIWIEKKTQTGTTLQLSLPVTE
ncbi:MAG TPA: response regulator [Anaerolineaceae bacterium]|nr:response regulator [Anaerolineaceae bacterium]